MSHTISRQAGREPRAGGFTLIELLAVVLILGLVAAMVAPVVGFGSSRALRGHSDQLADTLEFARQRAVMTGRSHRVVLDLDWALYRVEWQAPEAREESGVDPLRPDPRSALLRLVPPDRSGTDYVPVPGSFGRNQELAESVGFLGVELDKRTVKRGSVVITFEPDGLADAARIWLADLDGDENRVLELRPLADAVIVRDDLG